MLMKITCYKCKNTIEVEGSVGVRQECPKCKSDLHVCKNCAFYDINSYNECKETNADRVLDKEKANFCDYFKQASNISASQSQDDAKKEALKKLDSLFSK